MDNHQGNRKETTSRLNTIAVLAAIFWTALLLGSFLYRYYDAQRETKQLIRSVALQDAKKDMLYRFLMDELGGIYVPIAGKNSPDPYLSHVPDREIITSAGRRLTLIAPDYFMRRTHEAEKDSGLVTGHITSLKPLRPENQPDEWETKALQILARGDQEFSEIVSFNGSRHYRLMLPLIIAQPCLRCHAVQGVKLGEVYGGISSTIAMQKFETMTRAHLASDEINFGVIWVVGLALLMLMTIYVRRGINKGELADAALRTSEERYRHIVETSMEGIWIIDENFRTTYVNQRIADMLGYAPAEILGKPVDSFIFAEDLADYASRVDARRRGVGEVFERRFRRRDGTALWNIVSSTARFDGEGRFIGSFSMFTDITERKLADAALRASEQTAKRLADESKLIAEIGRIISSTLDIEEVYQRFADKVKQLIPFDRIAINTVNMKDYTRTIRYVQGDKFAGKRIGEVISLVGTGVEEIIRTKSSLLVNSSSTEDERERLLLAFQFGAQSTMLIPLILKDEVVGSLAVHSAQTDAYSEHDLLLAERMASQIAGSIANAQLFRQCAQVEEQLKKTLDNLRKAMSTTIQVMVATVEARDPYTSGHQLRSADLARAIATEMGLPQDKIEAIRMAASIHDIGKISIPAEILSKPTKLTEIEFALIKAHAQRGFEMLKNVESPWPLAEIVHQHHERMDGSGYPGNLKGDEICIEARILAVADVVEAMASHRPYRAGLGIDTALKEIEKNRGIFYDDAVAGACLKLFREKGFKLEGT